MANKNKSVLYSSAEIHSCIKQLFSEPNKNDRRVALVAYVGCDGESYLPHPENLHLICSPSAGGTSPETIRKMIKRKAKVQFSDGLHMKVYWSRERGCLITSANASSSALGKQGLKEAGVRLPPKVVDIDRLIRYAKPRSVTAQELRRLDEATKERDKHQHRDLRTEKMVDYLQWFASPHRSNWKLGWGDEEIAGTAKAAKETTLSEYGMKEPYSWQSADKGRVKKNDWLLCFTFTKRGVKDLKWIYVDFLIKISPKEKKFYYNEWPFHAVQVHSPARYALPPFRIESVFRSAFKSAIDKFTPEAIKTSKTDKPPIRLLKQIAKEMKKESLRLRASAVKSFHKSK